jgi:hypothetical protein
MYIRQKFNFTQKLFSSMILNPCVLKTRHLRLCAIPLAGPEMLQQLVARSLALREFSGCY